MEMNRVTPALHIFF